MYLALLLALLTSWLSTCHASNAPSQAADQLLKCYNFNLTWRAGEFQDFLRGHPSRLRLQRVLWSSKPLTGARARSLLGASQHVSTDNREATAALASGVHAAQMHAKEEAHGMEKAADAETEGREAAAVGPEHTGAGTDTPAKHQMLHSLLQTHRNTEHMQAARSLLDLPPPLLTIVTVATPSRLDALQAQCLHWPGPLSAAVYVPLMHTSSGSQQLSAAAAAQLAEVGAQVQAVFDSVEAQESACALRLLLLTELVSGGDDILKLLLPINTLRNAAMLAADTPLVAMVDVDLLPSASLAQEVLQDANKGARLLGACRQQRQVFVLPAFETHKQVALKQGRELVDKLVKGTKEELVEVAQSEQVIIPFAKQVYARGHNATDYQTWYRSNQPYRIQYQVNYEPWFVIDRCQSLPYDVRFRGYGWNKVQQVAHVASSNFTLMVHPTAFLLHRPHEKSGAQGLYNTAGTRTQPHTPSRTKQGAGKVLNDAAGTGVERFEKSKGVPPHKLFHRKVAAMRHVALRDMKRGSFVPVQDQESVHCRELLGWWAGGCSGR